MEAKIEFLIPMSGVSDGDKSYSFKVDDEFFEVFGQSITSKGDVDINVKATKKGNYAILSIDLIGSLDVECDRCLDHFDFVIDGHHELILRSSREKEEESNDSEDVVFYDEEKGSYDLAPIAHEFLDLAVPIKKVHPEDINGNSLCNPDMIKYLEKNNDTESGDPRWEALKKLK